MIYPRPLDSGKRSTIKKLLCLFTFSVLFVFDAQAGTLASKLYGVTGDGGTPAETLFELNKADASSVFVLTLGNGADGEEIAFNPDDGLLYHASGSGGGRVLETIDLGTLAISPVALSGAAYTEISGLTYEGSGVLLASDRVTGNGLYSITTAGVVTNIGATGTSISGLAYVGATLYAVSKNDASLRTINPATGATLGSVTMTLSGYTISGATGLATDPVDNTLWALLKVTDAPINPSFRALATVDSGSGVATLVGITDVEGLAGIAFASGNEVTVTSSVGTPSGTISPLGAQAVISGLSTSFTLTPDSGFQIASVGGTCGGSLADDIYTTNTLTADCTVVANFEPLPTTILYGVTGDGGVPAETLFQISTSDATTTLVLTLGNGNDGEEIAFNRDDGLLYHASGATGQGADVILETIDLDTLVVTPVALSGFNYKEVVGLTYAGSGVLMAGDRTASIGLSSITTAGAATNIGSTDATLMGMAYIGTTLYAVGKSDALLRTINPANGNTLGTVVITMSGYTISGATGLATNPDDNSLWALLKVDTGQPGDRALATVDPATGVATFIGITDVPGMAGIAFRFIPCDPCDVTPSVGTGPGSINPSTVQNVASGNTKNFNLNPDANHHIDFVGGTCGGSLAGSVFTTAAIYAHCTVVAHFTIDTFDLIYTAGAGGSISGTSPQTVDYDTSGTQVTAVPDPNFQFVSWSDGVLTASRTDMNVVADINVTANFAINTYTVTSSVGAGNGTISPLGGQQVDHGSSAQFTLTPGTGFHIDSVSGNCGGSLNGTTFTTNAITGPCTVEANFAIDTFTLTYTAGPDGSISGTTPQTVDYGTDGTLVTAVPDSNYHFVDWSDAVVTAARTDTNVMADIDVTANFAIDTYTVTSSVGAGTGTISPLGGQQVDHGSSAQFTLTPGTGFHIDSVGGDCGGSLSGTTYTTNAITGACTVVANFAIDTFTLTYTAGPDGSISGTTPQTVDYGTDGTLVTAVPDSNYHFVDWSDAVVTAARTDTNVMADINVTANFEIDTRTVISSVGAGNGSISPLGGQQIDYGSTTQFTLTPDANWHIESVDSTCGGSLVSDTYTTNAITADCSVIANFEIDTHTVTSSVGTGNGGISPLGTQEIDHGSTAQFMLTPDANWHIESVDSTCGGSLVSDTYTTNAITLDCTVEANFEIDTHTVTSSVGTGNGGISPLGTQEIDHGSTTQFTLTPDTNWHIESVGGTCGGSLVSDTYTTNAITTDCTVVANFEIDTHTVTSSVGTPAGNITPIGTQSVDHGDTRQFILAPDPNNHIDSVGGTCSGTLATDKFTTDPVTNDCTVIANFAIDTFTLDYTAGSGGSISGTTPQEVDYGSDGSEVTAIPDSHFDFVEWSDAVLTASRTDTNVMAAISVTANFDPDSHNVNSSVGTGVGTIAPLGDQSIEHGLTTQFTLTPDPEYLPGPVSGTCGGSLVGNVFTTSSIVMDCTVVASFIAKADEIISNGFED